MRPPEPKLHKPKRSPEVKQLSESVSERIPETRVQKRSCLRERERGRDCVISIVKFAIIL